jgi:hypothetical protein
VVGDADDDDSHPGEAEDADDHELRDYGRAGTPAEIEAATPQIKRYFKAAAAGNGAAACQALYSGLAKSTNLEAALPKEYKPAQGSTVFRGRNCAQAESLLFELDRQQLGTESATLVVTDLRVRGPHALAVLRFKTVPEHQIDLQQERGVWKADALIDTPVL